LTQCSQEFKPSFAWYDGLSIIIVLGLLYPLMANLQWIALIFSKGYSLF